MGSVGLFDEGKSSQTRDSHSMCGSVAGRGDHPSHPDPDGDVGGVYHCVDLPHTHVRSYGEILVVMQQRNFSVCVGDLHEFTV